MAITREQIWAVADELDAAGQSPTLAAVRNAVGGGSYTTIQEAMVEWKARKAAKEAPIREPAPSTIAGRLSEVGAEIWAAALELANARLAAERASLEQARAEIEAARQEAAELADQLTADLDNAKIRIASLEVAEEEARREADEQQARLAVLAEKASGAEARLEELRAERDQARSEAAAAREEAAELRGKLAAHQELLAAVAPGNTRPTGSDEG